MERNVLGSFAFILGGWEWGLMGSATDSVASPKNMLVMIEVVTFIM
jgi:hypothetical protein